MVKFGVSFPKLIKNLIDYAWDDGCHFLLVLLQSKLKLNHDLWISQSSLHFELMTAVSMANSRNERAWIWARSRHMTLGKRLNDKILIEP